MTDLVVDPMTGRLVAAQPGAGPTFLERQAGAYRNMLGGAPAPQPASSPAPALIGPATTGGTDMTPPPVVRPPMTDFDELTGRYNPPAPTVGPQMTGGTDLGPTAAPPPQEPPPVDAGAARTLVAPPQEPTPASSGIAPPPAPLPTPPEFVAQPPPAPAVSTPPQGVLSAPDPSPQSTPGDDIDAFAARLIPMESRRPDNVNGGGYAGSYQFGAPRLQTLGMYTPGPAEQMQGWGGAGGGSRTPGQWSGTFNIPGFENVRTLSDFLANPEAQRAAFRTHVQAIDRVIASTPGADAFDRNGLRAAAHIGGGGGLADVVSGRPGSRDANGQGPLSYYQRMAGSDAPSGSAGMLGRTANDLQAAQPDMRSVSSKPPPMTDPSQAITDPNRPPGMSPQAWFALSAGLFGGRNMNEGLSQGLGGMTRQMNLDTALQVGREDRASARADRAQARQDTNAYRAESLAVQRARANAAAGRGANGGAQTRGQPITLTDPTTGQSLTRVTMADGSIRTLRPNGAPETDEAVLNRLVARQDSGDATARSVQARQDIAFLGEIRADPQNIAASRQAVANLETVLDQNPNITGASLRAQGGRLLARTLGISVDGKTPQQVDALTRGLATLGASEIRQQSALFRPMSDTDIRTIMRNVPTEDSHPDNIRAWLDVVKRTHARAVARAEWVNEQQADPANGRTIRTSEGGWQRAASEFDRRWEEANPVTQSRIQANPATGGFTTRTPGGVGYSFQ